MPYASLPPAPVNEDREVHVPGGRGKSTTILLILFHSIWSSLRNHDRKEQPQRPEFTPQPMQGMCTPQPMQGMWVPERGPVSASYHWTTPRKSPWQARASINFSFFPDGLEIGWSNQALAAGSVQICSTCLFWVQKPRGTCSLVWSPREDRRSTITPQPGLRTHSIVNEGHRDRD